MKELEKNISRYERKIAEVHERRVEELRDLVEDLEDSLKDAEAGRMTDATSNAFRLARIGKLEEEERQLIETLDTLNSIKDDFEEEANEIKEDAIREVVARSVAIWMCPENKEVNKIKLQEAKVFASILGITDEDIDKPRKN